jgi:hypothetical protein
MRRMSYRKCIQPGWPKRMRSCARKFSHGKKIKLQQVLSSRVQFRGCYISRARMSAAHAASVDAHVHATRTRPDHRMHRSSMQHDRHYGGFGSSENGRRAVPEKFSISYLEESCGRDERDCELSSWNVLRNSPAKGIQTNSICLTFPRNSQIDKMGRVWSKKLLLCPGNNKVQRINGYTGYILLHYIKLSRVLNGLTSIALLPR